MSSLPPPRDTLEDYLQVATPEQVHLDLPIAGITMRAVALILDSLLLGLAAMLIGAGVYLSGLVNALSQDLLNALSIAIISLLSLGYYFAFEYFTHGRTPGKIACRLRVVDYAGDVPTAAQFFLRNLLRMADLALTATGIELFFLFWSPRNQRLGDLAAGTLVIRETAVRLADVERAMTQQAFMGQRERRAGGWLKGLEPADHELIKRYLARRAQLRPPERAALAAKIVEHFAAKQIHGLPLVGLTDEEKVDRLWYEIQSGGQREA